MFPVWFFILICGFVINWYSWFFFQLIIIVKPKLSFVSKKIYQLRLASLSLKDRFKPPAMCSAYVILSSRRSKSWQVATLRQFAFCCQHFVLKKGTKFKSSLSNSLEMYLFSFFVSLTLRFTNYMDASMFSISWWKYDNLKTSYRIRRLTQAWRLSDV
jgi:hypothetical protein